MKGTGKSARPEWVISACLCGEPVRYDGQAYGFSILSELVRSGAAICVCPECLGGLPVPRLPCEIAPGGRVYDRRGCDRTDAFRQGASRVLEICLRQDIRKAVFKEKSPSCGVRMRYDGSFTGRLIPGEGLTVRLLRRHGHRCIQRRGYTGSFRLVGRKRLNSFWI